MRLSAARSALVATTCALLLAPELAAQPTTPPGADTDSPAQVFALEHDSEAELDRVRIFSTHPVDHRLTTPNPTLALLRIGNAQLDDSVSPQLVPRPGGRVRRIRVYEARAGTQSEVRIELSFNEPFEARVRTRGSLITVEIAEPREEDKREEEITLELRGTQVEELVRTISQATGESFIWSDALPGRVTLHTPQRVTLSEARALLDTALLMGGFTILPGPEGKQKIVELPLAMGEAPWRTGEFDPYKEGLMATMYYLRAADAAEVSAVVAQNAGTGLLVVPYMATNALIVAGTENRIYKALELVNALDESARVDLMFRRLRHRSAEFAAGVLTKSFESRDTQLDVAQIWTDARTNSVIVQSTPELLAEARELLDDLDHPVEGSGGLYVYRVQYADPEKLREILEALATPRSGAAAPELPVGRRGAPPVSGEVLTGLEFDVAIDAPTRSLVIRAEPEVYRMIEDVLEQLDVIPTRVSVDIQVFEVATNDNLDLAFEALAPIVIPKDADDLRIILVSDPTGGGFLRDGVTARFTRAPLIFDVGDVTVSVPRDTYTFDAEQVIVTSRLLLNPQLLMVSGEEQRIVVGDEIPVPVSSGETNIDSLSTQVNFERRDTGIELRITPTVRDRGDIRLEMFIEVSSIAPSIAGDPSVLGPTIQNRVIEAIIHLRDAEVAIIGLADLPRDIDTERGFPFVKDIPFIGIFFRSTGTTRLESRLFVAAQARAMTDPADEVAESIRRRLGVERNTARRSELELDGRYAVRVATRRSRDNAETIAAYLASDQVTTAIGEWDGFTGTYYDVYLTGFSELEAATAAASEAAQAGWVSELVVMPHPDEAKRRVDDDDSP